jgi:hypothetical protein
MRSLILGAVAVVALAITACTPFGASGTSPDDPVDTPSRGTPAEPNDPAPSVSPLPTTGGSAPDMKGRCPAASPVFSDAFAPRTNLLGTWTELRGVSSDLSIAPRELAVRAPANPSSSPATTGLFWKGVTTPSRICLSFKLRMLAPTGAAEYAAPGRTIVGHVGSYVEGQPARFHGVAIGAGGTVGYVDVKGTSEGTRSVTLPPIALDSLVEIDVDHRTGHATFHIDGQSTTLADSYPVAQGNPDSFAVTVGATQVAPAPGTDVRYASVNVYAYP